MSLNDIVSREPATGVELWRAPMGDVDTDISLARAAQLEWAAKALAVRVETMRRFANVVRRRSEELIDLLSRETGLPLWESRAEIERVIAQINHAVSAYADRTPQRRLEGEFGAKTGLRHKPHGLVAIITSYASPASIPSGQILSALIAGNAVILKPSEKTPAIAALLLACYWEAGVPEDVLRLLIGGPAIGKMLAEHPDVNAVFFTGKTENGVALARHFAEHPEKLLSLGMSGNNPIIFARTGDIHAAAALIVQSAFGATGQRCTAGRRLIVENGQEQAVLDEVRRIIDHMIIAPPHDPAQPFIGPLIDEDAAKSVEHACAHLTALGASEIVPLTRPHGNAPFLTPAILDVTNVSQIPDQEIFGPVLQLLRVDDFASALNAANATRYGLAATLIGGDPVLYDRFREASRAGMISWNRAFGMGPLGAPAGGTGLSGNHRPMGHYAADACAFPVTSLEAEHARAMIGIGLRDS